MRVLNRPSPSATISRAYGRVGVPDMAARALHGARDIVGVTKPSQVTHDLQGLSRRRDRHLNATRTTPSLQDVAGMLAALGSSRATRSTVGQSAVRIPTAPRYLEHLSAWYMTAKQEASQPSWTPDGRL